MGTLESSKSYGLAERTQTLADLSRTRLNGPTPHQAPQRERVSRAQSPVRGSRWQRRGAQRRWTDLLSPDRNMGVPQLMMILEPNIVWERTRGMCEPISKHVESMYCPGQFFEGWHKAGRLAHGVYEGSYWELIGDCDEMVDMLRKLAKAPPLMEEPCLALPASPDLPKWDDFKPCLQALPSAPELPQLRLPPFRAPILDTEVPFIEPPYLHLPDIPEGPEDLHLALKEEPAPVFFPPEEIQLDPLVEPEYIQPEPPVGAEAPQCPVIGRPQHGHDWTGTRPFVIDLPVFQAPTPMDIPKFNHPPRGLPKAPLMDDLQLDRADLDLDPLPKVELAWECGPEPEPAYSSFSTSPRLRSRAGSPSRSICSSRPASALPSRPVSARGPPLEAEPCRAAKGAGEAAQDPPKWSELLDVDAGKPRAWINFEKPFADLPPIFYPPKPELGVVNGSEPMPEDFPPEALEMVPEFQPPEDAPLPQWTGPRLDLPKWMPPCEPRPIGFLRGTAPVLIIDVSGTMNPRMNGRLKEMKGCVHDLLDPAGGELATAASKFDVIAFSSSAWSWSATFATRMNLLASSQAFYSGRQAGGKARPGSSRVADKPSAGTQLQPTEPELLADAQNWVDKWPEAVGNTSMLGAFLMADEHWAADCWYIFSDGLAHDPSQCIDFLEARIRHGQAVPIIHTVGFFPEGAPENFEGRRYLQTLSAMTGGTFQEYEKNAQKIYQDSSFVKYDTKAEPSSDRVEREWAESQLRAERKKNLRLGISERLEVTLARVQALHTQSRVQTKQKEHDELLASLRAQYELELTTVTQYNAMARQQARVQYDADVSDTKARNQARMVASKAAFEEAHRLWMQVYEDALTEWQIQKESLEAQREEALAALNQSRASSRPSSAARGYSSRSASRPVSARTTTACRSPSMRPTSASRPPTSRPVSATNPLGGAQARPLSPNRKGVLPPDPQGRSPSTVGDYGSVPEETSVKAGASSRGFDAEESFVLQEGGDDVGSELLLPALELEDSQELKRFMFPEEVVRALDDENEAALAAIHDEWQRLVKDTEERNRKKLEVLAKNKDLIDKYTHEVITSYARGFAKDVVMGAALRTAANEMALAEARAAHKAEVERITAENARVATLHQEEVQEKIVKEQQYAKAMERWERTREQVVEKYKSDIAQAKKNHMENVARAEREWQMRHEEIELLNINRLKEAEAIHARLLKDVNEVNRKYLAEFEEKLKARKAIEVQNQARLAEARTLHRAKLDALQEESVVRLQSAQDEHRVMCARLAAEHEDAKAVAQREFEELRALLTRRNEALTEEARGKYQEALAHAQAEFDELCARVREEHGLEAERVRQHNEGVWPQVKIARLAAVELGRVQAFAEHIKYCANKYGLGVNFMPNTPNYDRVVEMQALTESLQRAFPEMPPDGYPWPDHERRGEPGTGWVAAPLAASLVLSDPAAEIMRIALGKKRPSTSRSAARSPLQASGTAATSPPHRPLSARVASPSPLISEAFQARPASASPTPSSETPASVSRTRFSNLATAAASELLNSPPVNDMSLNRYSRLHKSLSSPTAWGQQQGGMLSSERPQTARARSGSSQQTNKTVRPASASPRPAGGSRYLPARLSAKLGGMKGTLSAVRTTSGANSPTAGFAYDLPPEVHGD